MANWMPITTINVLIAQNIIPFRARNQKTVINAFILVYEEDDEDSDGDESDWDPA